MATVPRRSVLFVPALNERAIAKAPHLETDTVILDLEDSISSTRKSNARAELANVLATTDFGYREVLVRVNGLASEYWQDDIRVAIAGNVNGVVVPKIESIEQLLILKEFFKSQGASIPLWIMFETAKAIVASPELCAFGAPLFGVILGTEDLSKDLNVQGRAGMSTALEMSVLSCKANALVVLDGIYTKVKDGPGLEIECNQGKTMGFDGKTLIHPAQLEIANRVFQPSSEDVEAARELIAAWETANASGEGVCLFEGQMVEQLHVEKAKNLIDFYSQTEKRGNTQ